MPHEVFICHSAKDKPVADALCAHLEAAGVRCWIAPRDVPAGAEWAEAIMDGIEMCRIMVLVYSASSNDSKQVKREVQQAFDNSLTVIPFRLEDAPMNKNLKYYLGSVHWLDALTPPLEENLKTLAIRAKAILAAEAKPQESARRAAEAEAAPAKADAAKSWDVVQVGQRREVDLGSGVKLELCGIPAGKFTMGGTGSDETPHQVTLTQPFWLGRTQVTQEQWQAVMGNNPSRVKGKDLPVEQVSWDDAVEFCGKLNAKAVLPAGWQWALPSETQWEYACRAGTTGEYAGDLDAMAWHSENSGSTIHPVATKQPNAWGLHDMHGNVWEWCADWHGDFPQDAEVNPTGSNTGTDRVARGGSWFDRAPYCRAAIRYRYLSGARDFSLGLRLAAGREP